jgi:hypothetical protein
MNVLTMEELQNLSSPKEGLCVSIYLPTIKKGDQTRQNPTRYKNLLEQAEEKLEQAGMRKTEYRTMLNQAEQLQHDEVFWQNQEAGLAVFISASEFHTFKLPMDVPEQVWIKDRFYLKPLLSLLYQGGEFFILALSRDDVRLILATEHEAQEVQPPDLPKNMQDALGYDNLQQQQQWHTGTSPGSAGGGRRRAMFHGHGGGEDKDDAFLLNFLHMVDDSVNGYLANRRSPLILACVEDMVSEYKKANSYQHLVDDYIQGNVEHISARELRDKAWEKIKPIFETTRNEIIGRYKQLSGWDDNRTTQDMEEVLKAAPYGRVEVLFVDKNAKQWGTFDTQNVEAKLEDHPNPENYDLLDYAAVQTLLNGGIVYVVEPEDIPEGGSPVAAIFRF